MSNTITVPTGHLRRILYDVTPFVGRDDAPLDTVLLEAVDGVLSATATDRFTLGHARTGCTGDWSDPAVLDWAAARAVKRLLPKPASHWAGPHVTIERDDTSLTFTWQPADVPNPWSLTLPLSTKSWPVKYAALLDKLQDAEPGAAVGLNPAMMARFDKVSHDYAAPMVLHVHNAMSRVVVEIGDGFIGVIMPVKLWDAPTTPRVPLGHDTPTAEAVTA